jgi:uncharacterized membrane protein YfcA
MPEIFQNPWVLYAVFFIAGALAYIISTLSGGGGSLLLVPVINLLIGVKQTPPVVNLGNLIGEPVRIILFWKHIQWRVTGFYVLPGVVGAVLSALLFSHLKLEWLQVVVGLFLISTVFQYRFGKKDKSFSMKLWWFAPLGFIVSFFSTMIGAVGPVLNPFYLNYGLDKEKMISTKTINSFIIGLVQISSYTAIGALKGDLWFYGIILGAGASFGNWIGKTLLKRFSSHTFRKFVIALMVISGVAMILELVSFN